MQVREVSGSVSVIDIDGDVTGESEAALAEAYSQASATGAKTVIFNFTGLDYMNSSGIGLLVTTLIRARRQGQVLMAYGLTDHYRQIFTLTRLDEAIAIHDDEESALAAA
ncbi:MAG: STAS domain-containing protein [Acidimicrobiia bacterium]